MFVPVARGLSGSVGFVQVARVEYLLAAWGVTTTTVSRCECNSGGGRASSRPRRRRPVRRRRVGRPASSRRAACGRARAGRAAPRRPAPIGLEQLHPPLAEEAGEAAVEHAAGVGDGQLGVQFRRSDSGRRRRWRASPSQGRRRELWFSCGRSIHRPPSAGPQPARRRQLARAVGAAGRGVPGCGRSAGGPARAAPRRCAPRGRSPARYRRRSQAGAGWRRRAADGPRPARRRAGRPPLRARPTGG